MKGHWQEGMYKNRPTVWNKDTKGLCKPNSGSFKIGQNHREKHPNWKGGKTISRGYIVLNLPNKRHILEHRYIMEQHLGRKLNKKEVIHHINGNKTDNRIDNLKIVTNSQHNKIHFPHGFNPLSKIK